MRPSFFRHSFAAAALTACALCAHAQEQSAPPPPGLQQIDEGDESAITIRKPDAEREITERREDGVVTEIKVRSGKSTYYVRPGRSAGNTMPGDVQSPAVRPAEWVVHEFDVGQPKAEDKDRNESPEPVPATPVQVK